MWKRITVLLTMALFALSVVAIQNGYFSFTNGRTSENITASVPGTYRYLSLPIDSVAVNILDINVTRFLSPVCTLEESQYNYLDLANGDTDGVEAKWANHLGTLTYSSLWHPEGNGSLYTYNNPAFANSTTFSSSNSLIFYLNISQTNPLLQGQLSSRWMGLTDTTLGTGNFICAAGVRVSASTEYLVYGYGAFTSTVSSYPYSEGKEVQILLQIVGTDCYAYARNTTYQDFTLIGSVTIAAPQRLPGGDLVQLNREGAAVNEIGQFDVIGAFNYTAQGECLQSDYALYIGNTSHAEMNYSSVATTRTYSINSTKLNGIINANCTCSNCTVSDRMCNVPFIFKSNTTEESNISYSAIYANFTKEAILINELNNSLFNLGTARSVRLYYDDNHTFYDFTTNNKRGVNFSLITDKIRFEILYDYSTPINRYIDVDEVPLSFRVCANADNVTHYEQIMISTQVKLAKLRSTFSDCYVAADYTRFTYQDVNSLRAFTVTLPYELRTITGGREIFLVGIDGGIATVINIDSLLFRQQQAGIDTLPATLTFQLVPTDAMLIYYENNKFDNIDLSMEITRMDTDAQVLFKDDFADQNYFLYNFSYAALTEINDSTIFQIEVTETKADGSTTTLKRYVDTSGGQGYINPSIALIVSVLLLFFGLTMSAQRYTFSWFGIIIMVAAMGILTLSTWTWYTTMLIGMEVIMTVFIIIIMLNQNKSTLVS